MKSPFAIAIAALAVSGAITASAANHKDFGRLEGGKVVAAPMVLDIRRVCTNAAEVVTEAEPTEKPATDDAPTAVEYVTNTVVTVVTNYVSRGETRLTAADYLAAGWKRVVDEKPEASATNRYVYATGWTETDTEIKRVYAEADIPPEVKPPRKFSKLKIYGAIAQLGAWDKIKSWLEAKDVGGVNGWTAFQLAQEVSESHELFASLAEEARQLLGLTEADFNALLDKCVLEED